MRVASVLAILLLVAGCIGQSDTFDRRDGAKRVASAPRAEFDAWHVHDEWNGNTTKRLLERNSSGGGSGGGQSRFWGSVPFGATVIRGTAELRAIVHLNITDPTAQPSIEYRVPEETEWRSAPFTSGMPVSIIVEKNWTDVPHSNRTRWTIGIGFRNGSEPFNFQAHMIVDLIRQDGPLDRDPPHPDRWLGEESLELLTGSGTLNQIVVTPFASLNFGQPPTSFGGMKAVPEGTARWTTTLHYNSSTPSELHYTPRLSLRAANGDDLAVDMPPSSSAVAQQGFYRWDVNVAPNQTDSPYLEISEWGVFVRWIEDLVAEAPAGLTPRPTAMQGEYHLTAQAVRADGDR